MLALATLVSVVAWGCGRHPASVANCPSEVKADEITARLAGESRAGSDPHASFVAVGEGLVELGPYVPDQLRGDYQRVVATVNELVDVSSGVGRGNASNLDPQQRQSYASAYRALYSDELQNARANLQHYFATNCPGVQLWAG